MLKFNFLPSAWTAFLQKSGCVFLVFFTLFPCFLQAQAPPDLVWQRALGGDQEDVARSVQQTPDGGFIVAGNTHSNNGDVSSNSGGSDAWVIKLDGAGNFEWEKTFGGGGDDFAQSIQLTADGGYVLAGTKSGNAWVLKLDGDGNQVWEKSFGGNNYAAFNSIATTADDGFVVAGVRDISVALKGDGWIIKLDAAGNVEWEKTFGDELQDVAYSIQQTGDGDYIVAGIRDYNIFLGGSEGGDFWIFRLDETGNLLWEKVFGGSLTDRAFSVLQTSDGGYVAAGTANIYQGHVQVNNNYPNPLVVKLNADGSTHWVKSFTEAIFSGGAYSVCETPGGGFMVAGGGGLPDEGNPEVIGDEFLNRNLMLIELDAAGNLLSTNSFGGSNTDEALWISPTADSGYVVAGYTASNDGDVSGNHGDFDAWVVKLSKSAGVHFVDKDATGANDGTSWQDAYTDLQDALAAAQPGDHIWMAEGTYMPGTSANSTFLIEKDIQLYGGFAGTEFNLLQRNFETHPTLLSGDVNGDDIAANFNDNRSDNVNNILHLTSAVTKEMVLDGFIVQGGHADDNSSGAPEALRGGGLWSAGTPTMLNVTFRQNFAAELGAGAYFSETPAAVSVQDCMFEANKVKDSNYFGGAMVVYGSSGVLEVKDCIFQNNFTGGLGVWASNAEISECQFFNNNNFGNGAGLLSAIQTDSGYVLVKDCQFSGNYSGGVGAGILGECLATNNQLKVTGCTFEENIADGLSLGGGMLILGNSENDNIEIDNCIFKDNQADQGAGLFVQATFPGVPPGAKDLNVRISLCLFQDNHALNFNSSNYTMGGGICVLNQPGSENISMNIDSCWFWGNTSDSLGGGLAIYDEAGGGFYSVSNSFFFQNSAAHGGGMSADFQDEDAEVHVLNSDFLNNYGIGAWGGGIHTFFRGDGNTATVDGCQFNDNQALLGAGMHSEVWGNDNRVEIKDSGFFNNYSLLFGGGYRMQNTGKNNQSELTDCTFDGNQTDVDGGGFEFVTAFGGELAVQAKGVEVTNNHSTNEGAGINFFLQDGKGEMTLENCRIAGNVNAEGGAPTEGGGGITLINYGQGRAKLNLRHSFLENNDGDVTGGLLVWNNRPAGSSVKDTIFIENSLVADNTGSSTAGGISVNAAAEVFIFESTVAGNGNSGLHLDGGALAHLRNTILHNPGFDNVETAGEAAAISYGGVLSGDASADTFLGANDLSSTDPQFLGSGDHPYQLSNSSPAIDAAVPVTGLAALDLAGNARVQGSKMDIGAFESPFVLDAGTRLDRQSKLSVSPNPVVAQAKVSLENDWHGEVHLQVVNAQGQVVFEEKIQKAGKRLDATFDFARLAAGRYHLVVRKGEWAAVGRLVKL